MTNCSFILFLFSFLIVTNTKSQTDEDFIRSQFKKYKVNSLLQEKQLSLSREKVELGRLLFFDKIISGNKNISCSTCHHPSMGSGDSLPLSLGEGSSGLGKKRILNKGRMIPRNAPSVFNRGYPSFISMMWDHRIRLDSDLKSFITPEPLLNGKNPKERKYLEPLTGLLSMQAFFPVTSEDEMRGQAGTNELADSKTNFELWDKITERVININEYVSLFKKVYPNTKKEQLHYGHIAEAIGAFQAKIFVANNSKFDRFLLGRENLDSSELAGAALFVGRGKCIECHSGSHLTDFKTHALSLPQLGPGKLEHGDDKGEYLITKNKNDMYKFATPSLRNVELTGPWMHNGFFTNLKDAIKHHVDPINSLWECIKQANIQHHQPLFLASLDRKNRTNQERSRFVDPILFQIENLSDQEVEDIEAFLYTLTDTSSLTRLQIPRSVPSKLAVD